MQFDSKMSLHAGIASLILGWTLRLNGTSSYMNDTSLGIWLRRERERREITLRQIADQTKVAVPLLEGLEADDLSRWPAGIYRRAFVKSYAAAIGLDPDGVVKRFEEEHPPKCDEPLPPAIVPGAAPVAARTAGTQAEVLPSTSVSDTRARLLGTAADLTVAIVLGLGSAAAGSRLLWPVLFIAIYYAVGVLLTGTSPMVALLSDQRRPERLPAPKPEKGESAPTMADVQNIEAGRAMQRAAQERRHASRRARAQRAPRQARQRVQ